MMMIMIIIMYVCVTTVAAMFYFSLIDLQFSYLLHIRPLYWRIFQRKSFGILDQMPFLPLDEQFESTEWIIVVICSFCCIFYFYFFQNWLQVQFCANFLETGSLSMMWYE